MSAVGTTFKPFVTSWAAPASSTIQQRLATYTTDQRQLFTGSTLAVLKPATTKQVADVVRLAVRLGVGLVPQGGNTSYCGGATPNASGRPGHR